MFKVSNKYTKRWDWHCFGAFIVNFEQILHIIILVFPLSTSHKKMPAG